MLFIFLVSTFFSFPFLFYFSIQLKIWFLRSPPPHTLWKFLLRRLREECGPLPLCLYHPLCLFQLRSDSWWPSLIIFAYCGPHFPCPCCCGTCSHSPQETPCCCILRFIFSSPLCVYIHTCMCMGGCMYLCARTHAHRGQRSMTGVTRVLSCSLPASTRQILSLNLRLTVSAKVSPPLNPKNLPGPMPHKVLGLHICSATLTFSWVLGIELKPSFLLSEHFCSPNHHPVPEFFNNMSVSFRLEKSINTCTIYHPYLEPQNSLPDLKFLHI